MAGRAVTPDASSQHCRLKEERNRSLERLERRKAVRCIVPLTQLQSSSGQSPLPRRYSHIKTEDLVSGGRRPSQISRSLWDQIDDLPLSQLKKFLSKKTVEADRCNI